MVAVKKTGIEVLFQLANLERYRWLGHVQGLRSLGKTQQPGYV